MLFQPISKILPLLVAGAVLVFSTQAKEAVQPDAGQVGTAVARLLEQGHYTRQKLDAKFSEQFFDNYLRMLDYNRLYLLDADVEEFREKYGKSLHEFVLRGDLRPAHEIFATYRKRVEDRVAKNLELLKEPMDFSSGKTVEINREKAPWPKNQADADRLWRNRVEADLLQENLSETRIDSPETVLTRRYNQVLRNVHEQEKDDVVKTFLSALSQTYDPHSDYMSPSEMENFSISMSLSLVGVGAVLRSDEGYARIMEIVPGGPADLDGRLKANDRIAAVAQGAAPFEDTVDMKLDKVVEKIRGKKGTIVRLLVIPAESTDVAQRKVIEIKRDEVQLKDQEAKAQLIELPASEGLASARIGWITLPSFYSSNVDPRGRAARKSTTEDVSRLVKRLKSEGIDGLVIDLRRDGGGSLEEAINLTGLFIPEGPVVQVKDTNGRVSVQEDSSPQTLYNGPMVVVMNRLSASASEIFAAALQDYGRALIVGDERSFGKGTVQQVIDIGRFMPFFSSGSANAGSLKMTIQKFYRVKGGSTQHRGVESDIVLPSMTDTDEIGEGSLVNPLPYDEVAPRRIVSSTPGPLAFLDELRGRSKNRVSKEPEFQYIEEDMARLRKKIERNSLSLNRAERKAEVSADKERKEARAAERKRRGALLPATAYDLTLDQVDAKNLAKVDFEKADKKKAYDDEAGPLADGEENAEKGGKDAPVIPDVIRAETLLILQDMIELSRQEKTASTKTKKP